eukprot:1909560-Ditylum_brightwellii.AAC.1
MQIVSGIQNHWPKELWQDPDSRKERRHQAVEQCTPRHGRKHGKICDVKVQIMTAADQGTGFPEIWGMKKRNPDTRRACLT